LPEGEPQLFETAREAWEYLVEERKNEEEEWLDLGHGHAYSVTVGDLQCNSNDSMIFRALTGTVQGYTFTPDGNEHGPVRCYTVNQVVSTDTGHMCGTCGAWVTSTTENCSVCGY